MIFYRYRLLLHHESRHGHARFALHHRADSIIKLAGHAHRRITLMKSNEMMAFSLQ